MITTKKITNFGKNSIIAIREEDHLRDELLYGVTQCGFIEGLKDWSISRKGYDAFCLIYCYSGEASLNYNGKFFKIKQGDLAFFDQSVKHTIFNENNEPFVADYAYVYGKNVHVFFERFYSKFKCVLPNFNNEVFSNCVKKITISIKSNKEDENYTSLLVYSILMDLIKNIPQEDTSDVGNAVKYLNENYFKEDVLSTLYTKTYLSKYHFIRKFHNRTGHSPKEYLDTLRFRAVTKLLTTNKTLTEIASLCGLKDYSLSFLIKSKTGLSPSLYRQQLHKNQTKKSTLKF